MKAHLTDISVRKLALPEAGQVTHWDTTTPGFGIRCSTKSKSFVVMYGAKRKLKTLGKYPDLRLSDARKKARKLLVELEQQPKSPQLNSITFKQSKESFLADCAGRNKDRTVKDYTRLLNRHFKFRCSLPELQRRHVMKVITELSATPSEQAHAYVAIRTLLNWCVRQGMLEHNPLPAMSFKAKERTRILNDSELRVVYQRALEFPYPYGPIIQLIIHTGQRRTEIASLRRNWIEHDCIVYPEGFTKNKREHRIPISGTVQKLITLLPEMSDLYFPSRHDDEKPFNGWGKCKVNFDKELGIAPYTLHDLRRTYSSKMAELGTPIHVTEKLLNHISGTISGVAAVYNRYSYMEEMFEAAKQYENFLSGLTSSLHSHTTKTNYLDS